MTLSGAPGPDELPTTLQLKRATALAMAVAGVILVAAVLPAEYGLDPTGVGRILGLTDMGRMKRGQAETVVMDTMAPVQISESAAPASSAEPMRQEITLSLKPNGGTEVKAVMMRGQEFEYVWSTSGPKVMFELHGERTGAAPNVYTSYEKGVSAGGEGKLRAPFDGTHGWYWKNLSKEDVTITVRATGAYQKFSQLH